MGFDESRMQEVASPELTERGEQIQFVVSFNLEETNLNEKQKRNEKKKRGPYLVVRPFVL